MARKKKSAQADVGGDGHGHGHGDGEFKKPSTSALIICRNKHWRYISSFHGPWLQLPPEVLESLAHTNLFAPRPQPIDPAVFFDLVKIRRHVDEATNLAVRAASGLTAAALSSSLHGNSMLGQAAALGLGYGGGGGKLSRERKHRMRELATAKLSAAYRLDEIAASVATMQSASTLEDVAHLVLQRSPNDVDAKYVHFFHEKIPSRMMAQCTPLDALDDIIAERPADGSALRTRALTRIFKDDYANAAKDLTEALATARYLAAQHRKGRDQLVLARTYQEQQQQQQQHGRDWRSDVKIPDEDHPSSLETQLLFHRAGIYLTIACGHVHPALDGLRAQEEAKAARDAQMAAGEEPTPETAEEVEGRLFRAESRKQVRQNAKRALRDYTAFLSHFDYTPGISPEAAEEFLQRIGHSHGQTNQTNGHPKDNRLLDYTPSTTTNSEALTPYRKPPTSTTQNTYPNLPPPTIHPVSSLFSPTPPSSLPPYPPLPPSPRISPAAHHLSTTHESLTYHPLLSDAIHSLLLCHSLLQTPAKEHLRHAHNAARLIRVCEGYPIFLTARSPARADWGEVLRRGGDWIHLGVRWETFCSSPSPSSHTPGTPSSITNGAGNALAKTGVVQGNTETTAQRRERQKHEAILEALADERVVDEVSFQRAVRAREVRFREDEAAAMTATKEPAKESGSESLTKNVQHVGEETSAKGQVTDDSSLKKNNNNKKKKKEEDTTIPSTTPSTTTNEDTNGNMNGNTHTNHPISTDRAAAITRWVLEAPSLVSSPGSGTGTSSGRGGGCGDGGKKRRRKVKTVRKERGVSGEMAELDITAEGGGGGRKEI